MAQRGPAFLEIVPRAEEAGSREADAETLVPAADPEPFELVLRSGHRVRVPAQFDPAALRRLVDVLEAR